MCVFDLKHFPVMTLRQNPAGVQLEGLENLVISPSGAINVRVFSFFESVANARYGIVKPITTLLLRRILFSEFDCSQPQRG